MSSMVGFFGCVPIEDLARPLIGEFNLKSEYNVSDTIRLQAILSDNFGINKVRIEIKPVQSVALPWIYIKSRDSVGARLLNLDESKVIPSNISLGEYELTLTIIDVSGLERTISKKFVISGDVSDPTFVDVILPELELIGDNLYKACRSDLIKIGGTVRDNVGLKELRVQLGSFPPIVRALTGQDSVDLSSAFSNSIIVPTNVANGTTIPLQFQATDIEGNISRSVTINILIECDDELPVINSLTTNLTLTNSGLVEVIQGQKLFITDGKITDDDEIDSVFIYFVDKNNELLLKAQKVESGNSTISLAAIFGNIAVPIPSTARVGSTYEIVVVATDVSGNESVAYIVKILITRNASPQILIASTYVNSEEVNFSFASLNAIPAGAKVRVEGKVEEDVALEYYRVTWGTEGKEETIVDLNQSDLENNLPFNIASPISRNEFVVDENARSGTRYILTFFVKDLLNPEVRLRYTFIIR